MIELRDELQVCLLTADTIRIPQTRDSYRKTVLATLERIQKLAAQEISDDKTDFTIAAIAAELGDIEVHLRKVLAL